MPAKRVGFVISERLGGLTEHRLREYDAARERVASVSRAEIRTAHYTELEALDVDAVVLSGSHDPWALHEPGALEQLAAGLRASVGPVLGICAGMQNLVRAAGGSIGPAETPVDSTFAAIEILDDSDLFAGVAARPVVFQNHGDEVQTLPDGLRVLARSPGCPVEAIAALDRPWWGTQFHPEAWTDEHPAGRRVLENFFLRAGLL